MTWKGRDRLAGYQGWSGVFKQYGEGLGVCLMAIGWGLGHFTDLEIIPTFLLLSGLLCLVIMFFVNGSFIFRWFWWVRWW